MEALPIPAPASTTFPLQSSAQSSFLSPMLPPNNQSSDSLLCDRLSMLSAPPSEVSEHETAEQHEQVKRKRHAKPPPGVQLTCAICGDAASGYNFEAICCESCKAFFRRNGERADVRYALLSVIVVPYVRNSRSRALRM